MEYFFDALKWALACGVFIVLIKLLNEHRAKLGVIELKLISLETEIFALRKELRGFHITFEKVQAEKINEKLGSNLLEYESIHTDIQKQFGTIKRNA